MVQAIFLVVPFVSSVGAAQVDCQNQYFPADGKTVYTYERRAPKNTSRWTETRTIGKGFILVEVRGKDPMGRAATSRSKIVCAKGGLEASKEIAITGASFKADTFLTSGALWPTELLWKLGYKWQNTLKVAGAGKLGILSVKGSVDSASSNTIIGPAEVKVPAGIFQAFKISKSTRSLIKTNLKLFNRDNKTTSTQWVASGTGLVREESDDGKEVAITELISVERAK
jgi:hypothetical protein